MRTFIFALAAVVAIASLAPTDAAVVTEYAGQAPTYFAPGHGAYAGEVNSSNDMVAALSGDVYGNVNRRSQYCDQCAFIQGPKGTVTVRIVDACPSCERHSLDLTLGAFKGIAEVKDGIVPIQWWWTRCPTLLENIGKH
ncbi:RlpA-like double-psi beta-barrel-protein domain-containing protein-containing protein [Syncephalis fuscata]|nr:RlpA-like double-psi beta-barrel-protein domain-containing protein-containing protein [Syncephalis fuscata]